MRHVRDRDGSTLRRAANSVSSSVVVRLEGTPHGVPVPRRRRHRVDLEHGVVGVIDLDVEPHVEEVLVDGRSQAGRHQARVHTGVSPVDPHGRHDPGQLDLELQGAVEIEVPVEPVLVVADGGDGADDQAPGPAHLGASRRHVDVLPEDGVVLLVHADGVGPGVRLAPLVGKDVVEVVDLAEAVTPLGQRVGHAAETPLPSVEGTLPRVHGARVPVGHDHLADRGAVDDRPYPPAVLVADGREHQSLQRVHADAQRPLLPAHEVALHLEARAIGLGDLQWLQVRAERTIVLGVVTPGRGRDGDRPVVEHLEHLAASHVDDRPATPREGGRSRCRPQRRAGRRCTW